MAIRREQLVAPLESTMLTHPDSEESIAPDGRSALTGVEGEIPIEGQIAVATGDTSATEVQQLHVIHLIPAAETPTCGAGRF